MSRTAVIVDIVRTPMGRGKIGGALSHIHPVDLLGQTLKILCTRNQLDPARIDDVLIGCVTQVSEQANVARMSALAAGFPVQVPATTIDRKCGSSQQAVHFAGQAIVAGAYDIAIAGGVESMSRVPMGSNRLSPAGERMDDIGTIATARFPGMSSQGIAAEMIAARWEIDRESLDAYAARSHQLAAAARDSGSFDSEIVAVAGPDGTIIDRDESIRDVTTSEGLAQLKPVFRTDASVAEYPALSWSVTAGNASQITDGASAALIMEESVAVSLGLRPRARIVAYDVVGDDPVMMLTAPIPATRRILRKAGLDADMIDHYEVNEAFASIPLAWQKEMKVDPARLNPRGGAIALGHPLGCSGTRLMATMLNALEQTGGRFGLQTMCEAGGMANATLIERL
ncbi:acetyl-CoA acetyltransferase [Sphingobium chlorophenolicum L-1]|uniref:Acetyl-CoA acetyltransferase n=1 Tax=Sphingobium chlorophenolicum L-1 TaxID=690566 RepID=F6EWB8_SPHCR|nr:thiolase family protein [Sphingobium chlorophenolicum]AEG49812.1 acetyl-CoA acetyltransferase [Sphingobium chlorophenolicum L-1]